MDSVVDSPAIHRGLGVVNDGRKDLFDGSVILQIIHVALLLVQNGSNGGILICGELGLPDCIDVSEILRADQVPEMLIEFSSDAVNVGTLLVLYTTTAVAGGTQSATPSQ